MDDSTANLLVFLCFIIVMVFTVLKIIYSSDEEVRKMAKEADERRSNAIKRGIQYSKIHGTKKSRKIKY